jgi:coiled-coil and C2 domain-containing protein 1
MVDSAKQGLAVDWSCLPSIDLESEGIVASNTVKTGYVEVKPDNPIIQDDNVSPLMDVSNEPSTSIQVPIIPIPQSTLEALEQRLAKYQSIMQQAQEEGNSSKARRFGRIVKQYQDAIKLSKHGKPIPFDELPDPPGILFDASLN